MKEGEDSGQSINLGGRQERREEGGKRKAGRSEEKVARPKDLEVGSVKSLQGSLPALHSGGWQTNIPATQEREGDVTAQSFYVKETRASKRRELCSLCVFFPR